MQQYKKKHPKRHNGHSSRRRTTVAVVVTVAVVAMLGLGIWAMSTWGPLNLSKDDSSSSTDEVTYDGKTYVPNDHLSNYLFLGVDTDESLGDGATHNPGEGGQADAIYLVSYDRMQKTLSIFAIPRDTMTQIETFSLDGDSLGLSNSQLALQYAYGDGRRKSCELMESAVSRLMNNLHIDGYAALSLESLSHLTELVGYVDVVVPDNTLEQVDPEFVQGATVRLTADNTETFVRTRDTNVDQSAMTRLDRQKVYIKAFINRVRELQGQDSSTVSSVYDGLQQHMITTMGTDVMLNLIQATDTGDIQTIPGQVTKGDVYDEFNVDQDALYKLIIQNFYQEK